jgi:Zn-dependent protease
VKLFRVSGIDVYLHALFILLAAVWIFQGFQHDEPGWTFIWLGALWVSVLLHEFGHCWGARRVGGDAQEILLWPLGGLADCDAPMTPWAQFVTTACGPAVNVILAAVGVLVGWLAFGADPVRLLRGADWNAEITGTIVHVNVMLFTFNMIPAFPMDAGRLLQVALWTKLGFQRATRIAIYTSFVCSAALIVSGFFGSGWTGFIGVWVLLKAIETLRYLNAGAFAEYDEPWRQSLYIRDEKPRQPGFIARWLAKRRDARVRAVADAEAARTLKLDDVLRRVAEVGMDGLSREERAFLDLESARLRSQKPPAPEA